MLQIYTVLMLYLNIVHASPVHENLKRGSGCLKLQNITNGVVVSCSSSICEFTCNKGYGNDNTPYISPVYQATCQSGGWEYTECTGVTCQRSDLPNSVNSSKCSDVIIYNRKCRFTCAHGHDSDGPFTATCSDDNDGGTNGKWVLNTCIVTSSSKCGTGCVVGIVIGSFAYTLILGYCCRKRRVLPSNPKSNNNLHGNNFQDLEENL